MICSIANGEYSVDILKSDIDQYYERIYKNEIQMHK